jgi:hypothetical protein
MAEYILFVVPDEPSQTTTGISFEAEDDQRAINTRPSSLTIERLEKNSGRRDSLRFSIEHLRREIWQIKPGEPPRFIWSEDPK